MLPRHLSLHRSIAVGLAYVCRDGIINAPKNNTSIPSEEYHLSRLAHQWHLISILDDVSYQKTARVILRAFVKKYQDHLADQLETTLVSTNSSRSLAKQPVFVTIIRGMPIVHSVAPCRNVWILPL